MNHFLFYPSFNQKNKHICLHTQNIEGERDSDGLDLTGKYMDTSAGIASDDDWKCSMRHIDRRQWIEILAG